MASSSSAQVYDEDDYEVYEDEEEEDGEGLEREEGKEEEEEESGEEDEEEEQEDAVVVEERQSDEEDDEEDWALLSSSPSPQISPLPPRPRPQIPSAPRVQSQNHTRTQRSSASAPVSALQCSPQCSMDDDSSTDASEEDDLLPPPPSSDMSRKRKRRRRSERRNSSPNTSPPPPPPPPSLGISEQQQLDISPATTIHQRKAQIKNLELKFQKECRAHCRTLIALQQQWRQELESPVPGLTNDNYLHQQELYKQKGGLHSQTDIQMQNSIVAAPKSRATSNYKHSGAPAIADATSTKVKAPRHWYDD